MSAKRRTSWRWRLRRSWRPRAWTLQANPKPAWTSEQATPLAVAFYFVISFLKANNDSKIEGTHAASPRAQLRRVPVDLRVKLTAAGYTVGKPPGSSKPYYKDGGKWRCTSR